MVATRPRVGIVLKHSLIFQPARHTNDHRCFHLIFKIPVLVVVPQLTPTGGVGPSEKNTAINLKFRQTPSVTNDTPDILCVPMDHPSLPRSCHKTEWQLLLKPTKTRA